MLIRDADRPLAWSTIVDDAVAVYRRNWSACVKVAAAGTVLTYVLQYLPDAGLLVRAISDPRALLEPRPVSEAPIESLLVLPGMLVTLCADVAVAAIALDALAGRQVSVSGSLRTVARKFWVLVRAYVLWLVRLLGLALASTALLILVALGFFGILPLIGLALWATRRRRRTRGLKWLIVLTTPFGWLMYAWVTWVLWAPLILIEGVGAREALARSERLARGRWFSLAVVELLALILSALLVVAPWLIVAFVGGVLGITRGLEDSRPLVQYAYTLASAVPSVLIVSIRPIALTLLTVHLRNLVEGADLLTRMRPAATMA